MENFLLCLTVVCQVLGFDCFLFFRLLLVVFMVCLKFK